MRRRWEGGIACGVVSVSVTERGKGGAGMLGRLGVSVTDGLVSSLGMRRLRGTVGYGRVGVGLSWLG